VNKEKEEQRARVKQIGLSPAKIDRAEKRDLAIENERLKDELRRAESMIIELLWRCGQL
jgi:hypothetical protein